MVAGFLHVLKVQYEDGEIRKKGPEPVDVWFRDARFQVTEILDEGRRRDAELRGEQERIEEAESLQELWTRVQRGNDSLSPTACMPSEYYQLILDRSQEKLEKYGKGDEDIDLLIYINRKGAYLWPTEPWPVPTQLMEHGWRSVAFVDNCYARVLYTTRENDPDFLRKAEGKTHGQPPGAGKSIFPQRLGPEDECKKPGRSLEIKSAHRR